MSAAIMYADIDKARGSQDAMNLVYKTYAESYDTLTDHHIVLDSIENQVAKHTTMENPLILDVACGTGLNGVNLHAKGFKNLHGVDLCEEMLNEARKKNVYNKLWQGKITEIEGLDVADNSYDVVTCTTAISEGHIRPKWALREFVRVTKPGGICAYTVNDKTNSLGFIQALGDAHQEQKCEVLQIERLPSLCSFPRVYYCVILKVC